MGFYLIQIYILCSLHHARIYWPYTPRKSKGISCFVNKCIADFENVQPCRDPQRRFTIMRNLLPNILLAHLIFWGKDVEISNQKCFLDPIPFTSFRYLINAKYNPKNHIEGVAGFS